MCDVCQDLLAEGLDLCVRARKLDAMDRTNATLSFSKDPKEWENSGQFEMYATRHNIVNPHAQIMTKSGTMHLWVVDQYEKDLLAWETKSRNHLIRGCN